METAAKGRLEARFELARDEGRAAFVAFVTAGDPNAEQSQEILEALPGAGVDIIELGMPFTDPMADGPAIQASSLRALRAGQTMIRTLDQVRRFREKDSGTPIVLMGYYNPIYHYGVDRFLEDAVMAGVDGLIIVDLPPEEDDELCLPAQKAGLRFIRLLTPTTDGKRRPMVLRHTSGFLYYVSITGITGAGSASAETIGQALAEIRRDTDLPIAVGFGIKTSEQAADMARVADGVVIGSAIVSRIAEAAGESGHLSREGLAGVVSFTHELAEGVRRGRAG